MAARPTSVRRTASRKPERVIRSPDALDARRTARGSQPTRRPRERERRTVRERIVDAGYNARVTACRHRLERTTTAPTAAVERHPGCGGTTAATPACVDPTYSRRGDDAAARERHRPSSGRHGLAEFPVCDPQTGVARDPWVTEAAMCVRLVGVRITCGLHDIAQLAAIFIDPRAE